MCVNFLWGARMASFYPVMRDLQTRMGPVLTAKVALQRWVRTVRKRPFEAEFEVLKRLDFKTRCALDVGANRGQSIDAIKLFQPTCTVHAFEPNPALARLLEKRFDGQPNIKIENCGLGNTPSQMMLYIPYYRGFLYDGLASLDRQEAAGWLNEERVWRFNPDLVHIEEAPCQVKNGDELGLVPAFLKIDVQGFEQQVLEGLAHTIEAHRPLILMENNPPGDNWLTAQGWQRASYEGGQLVAGKVGGNNTIYVHPESREHQALLDAL